MLHKTPRFYNGQYWVSISVDQLKHFLIEVAVKTGNDYWQSKYFRFAEDLVRQFETLVRIAPDTTQTNIVTINLLNGTAEFNNGNFTLREWKKEDYLTYQLAFEYNCNASSPLFQQFLDKVLPDKSCQHIIAEYIAYAFTDLKLEKALFFYGSGANGKSVIFEIVNALLGPENVTNFSLGRLSSSEYNRAQLSGKLINYASEIDDRVDRSLFKTLASGEPIDGRHPYSAPFIMHKYAKLWFNCNELFYNPEITPGFFRRLLIIPFSVTIPDGDQDPNLPKNIIKEELPGILNWIIAGLHRLNNQGGFTHSETVESFIKSYHQDSDTVQAFLRDLNYVKSTEFTLLPNLYKDYQQYCKENGHHALSNQKVKTRLKTLGITVERRNIGNCVWLVKNETLTENF